MEVKNQPVCLDNGDNMHFTISKQEHKTLQEWLKKHNKKCKFANPISCGVIGGRLTYMFTPTSLGCLTGVKCACGKILLIDINEW